MISSTPPTPRLGITPHNPSSRPRHPDDGRTKAIDTLHQARCPLVSPWVSGIICLALLGVACSEAQSHSGTNTNWLRRCASDDECGAALTCLCGRCSVECEDDDGCESGSSCASDEANRLQCGGEAPRICQARCIADTDCSTGELCYFGSCSDALAAADCAADPDVLVCEDFERPIEADTIIATEGNTVETVAARTPSGSRTLEADIAAAPSVAYWRADIPAQTGGTLGLRGWVRVPEVGSGYDLAPLGLWSDSETDWALRLVLKDASLELWSYTTPLAGSYPLTPGAWYCLQALVDIAEGPDGTVTVWVDGEPVLDATGVDTLPTDGIEALSVGSLWAGAPATLQVDRVELAHDLPGCWD